MDQSRDNEPMPDDPRPCYATPEEIALAECLLRRIEARYLANENGCGEAPQPLREAA